MVYYLTGGGAKKIPRGVAAPLKYVWIQHWID